MKQLIQGIPVKARAARKRLTSVARNGAAAAFALAVAVDAHAQAGGFQKAKGILETVKTELTTIIPVVATIALLGLGIGYATKFVEKDTFIRWGIGIIIAGSAAQLTAMFFT